MAQAALATAINRFMNQDLLGGGRSRTSTVAYDRNPSLREPLDAARQRLDGRFVDAPLIEAGLRTTLGVAYRTLGDYAVAETELRRATELNKTRLAPGDETRLLAEYDLVGVLVRLSKFDEAKQRLDAADALAAIRSRRDRRTRPARQARARHLSLPAPGSRTGAGRLYRRRGHAAQRAPGRSAVAGA